MRWSSYMPCLALLCYSSMHNNHQVTLLTICDLITTSCTSCYTASNLTVCNPCQGHGPLSACHALIVNYSQIACCTEVTLSVLSSQLPTLCCREERVKIQSWSRSRPWWGSQTRPAPPGAAVRAPSAETHRGVRQSEAYTTACACASTAASTASVKTQSGWTFLAAAWRGE